jgi:hypothetical protein
MKQLKMKLEGCPAESIELGSRRDLQLETVEMEEALFIHRLGHNNNRL